MSFLLHLWFSLIPLIIFFSFFFLVPFSFLFFSGLYPNWTHILIRLLFSPFAFFLFGEFKFLSCTALVSLLLSSSLSPHAWVRPQLVKTARFRKCRGLLSSLERILELSWLYFTFWFWFWFDFCLQQCKIDLYDCVKSGKDKKVCLSEYKTCMSVLLPTVPPFIVSSWKVSFKNYPCEELTNYSCLS